VGSGIVRSRLWRGRKADDVVERGEYFIGGGLGLYYSESGRFGWSLILVFFSFFVKAVLWMERAQFLSLFSPILFFHFVYHFVLFEGA
jgi:hypothetical protein